jgi:hypothetical protein
MGPHRIIHNSRGYLTETVFDEKRGIFTERPFPPPAATTQVPSSADQIRAARSVVEHRMRIDDTDNLG